MRSTFLGAWTLLFLAACSSDAMLASDPSVPASYLAAYSDAPEPLPGNERRWVYTEVGGALCRDGSPAGVAVNLGPRTDKLMIYLEQGGMCFNEISCALNPANAALYVWGLGWLTAAGGVFDRTREANAIRDWSYVYVPYCTGDLHMGANADAEVPGVGPQKFVGYRNMEKILPRIAATFAGATEVLLAGESAGGFGSFTHASHVQTYFPDVKVKVLNDCGPPVTNAVFPECVQGGGAKLWGADQTLLAACGADCPDPNDYLQDFAVHVAKTLSDRPVGVIASLRDAAVLSSGDVAANGCKGPGGLLSTTSPTPPTALRDDLLAYRARVESLPNVSTFYPDSDVHMWTATSAFYDVSAGGVRLPDWFRRFVQGHNPGHVGE